MKTAEQIAAMTDHLDGRDNIRAINKLYRYQEGGADLEYAIRQVRAYAGTCGGVYGLEYCYLLENHLSHRVNQAFA